MRKGVGVGSGAGSGEPFSLACWSRELCPDGKSNAEPCSICDEDWDWSRLLTMKVAEAATVVVGEEAARAARASHADTRRSGVGGVGRLREGATQSTRAAVES